MKKPGFIILISFFFAGSHKVDAQQKPSQRPISEELNKISQKRSLRYKIADQNLKQIVQNKTDEQRSSTQQPASQDQGNQQSSETKVSNKPITLPDHFRKQQ